MIELSKVIEPLDPTIKIVNVHKEPFRYQISVVSTKATTKPSPQIYVVKFESNTEKLNPSSKIKGYCDCHDFRYRLAYCWYEHDALLLPPAFLLRPPEKTNPGCKMRMCKHMATVAHYILARHL